ncbi:MAG: DUF167 domain-containing protein [Patescibacteria group bacterium]
MYIHVKVTPGAKRESLKKLKTDHYAILVKEPAERNLANRRVTELLSAHLATPLGKIRLVNGHRSPSKIFSIN